MGTLVKVAIGLFIGLLILKAVALIYMAGLVAGLLNAPIG